MKLRIILALIVSTSLFTFGPQSALAKEETSDWPVLRGNLQGTGETANGPVTETVEELWKVSIKQFLDPSKYDFLPGYLATPTVSSGEVIIAPETFNLKEADTSKYFFPIFYFNADTGNVDGLAIPFVSSRSSFAFSGDKAVVGNLVFEPRTKAGGQKNAGRIYWALTCYKTDPRVRSNLRTIWSVEVNFPIDSSPVIEDGKVFVGNDGGALMCVELETGKKVWQFEAISAIKGSLSIVSSKIFIGTTNGTLHCVSKGTGQELWHFKARGAISATPAVYDNKIYLGSQDGVFYCLDAANGREIWSFKTDMAITGSSCVVDKRVYASVCSKNIPKNIKAEDVQKLKGGVFCLDHFTGKLLWQIDVPSGVCSSPAASNGKLYFCSIDGHLYCVDLGKGKILWKNKAGGLILSSPTLAYGRVYVSTMDGFLRCYGRRTHYPNIADFQRMKKGQTKTIEVELFNLEKSEQAFHPTSGAKWLKLDKQYVRIKPGKSEKIKATADTTGLETSGLLSTTIDIGGDITKGAIDVRVYVANDDLPCSWNMFRGNIEGTGAVPAKCGISTSNLVKLWEHEENDWIISAVAIEDGSLVFALDSLLIGKLDLATGKLDGYRGYLGYLRGAPTALDGKTLLGTTNGFVYCIDTKLGFDIWSFETQGRIEGSVVATPERVFFGSTDGSLYCADMATGKEVWSYKGGEKFSFEDTAAVSDGMVFASSSKNSLFVAVDEKNGREEWTFDTGYKSFSSPAVYEGKVFFGSGPMFFCLEAKTGKKLWEHKSGGSNVSSPAIADGKVFFGSMDNHMYCLDAATGKIVWKHKTDNAISSSPAYSGGKVFIGADDKNIYCFDAVDGKVLWSYKTGDRVWGCPVIVDGKLYIASNDYKLYCFGEDQSQAPSKIEIEPATASLKPGEILKLTAKVFNIKGENIQAKVEWASSKEDVGTVDQNGLFTAKTEGETQITATSGDKKATASVKVARQLDEDLLPPEFTTSLEFAIGGGKTQPLMAHFKNPNDKEITVNLKASVTWIKVDKETIEIEAGGSANVLVSIEPQNEEKKEGKIEVDWRYGQGVIKISIATNKTVLVPPEIDTKEVFMEFPDYFRVLRDHQQSEVSIKNPNQEPINLESESFALWLDVTPKTMHINPNSSGILVVKTTYANVSKYRKYGQDKVQGSFAIFFEGNKIAQISVTVQFNIPNPLITIDKIEPVRDQKEIMITGNVPKNTKVTVNDIEATVSNTRFAAKIKLVTAPSKTFVLVRGALDDYTEERKTEVINIHIRTVKLWPGKDVMMVDEKEVKLDVAPMVKDGGTLVPVRAIASAFWASVEYNSGQKTVKVTLDKRVVELKIGSNIALVDGKEKQVNPAPQVVAGRTMVPFRFIAEALGASVEWDAPSKTITIKMEGWP